MISSLMEYDGMVFIESGVQFGLNGYGHGMEWGVNGLIKVYTALLHDTASFRLQVSAYAGKYNAFL